VVVASASVLEIPVLILEALQVQVRAARRQRNCR
jgi:hypothetical protein